MLLFVSLDGALGVVEVIGQQADSVVDKQQGFFALLCLVGHALAVVEHNQSVKYVFTVSYIFTFDGHLYHIALAVDKVYINAFGKLFGRSSVAREVYHSAEALTRRIVLGGIEYKCTVRSLDIGRQFHIFQLKYLVALGQHFDIGIEFFVDRHFEHKSCGQCVGHIVVVFNLNRVLRICQTLLQQAFLYQMSFVYAKLLHYIAQKRMRRHHKHFVVDFGRRTEKSAKIHRAQQRISFVVIDKQVCMYTVLGVVCLNKHIPQQSEKHYRYHKPIPRFAIAVQN